MMMASMKPPNWSEDTAANPQGRILSNTPCTVGSSGKTPVIPRKDRGFMKISRKASSPPKVPPSIPKRDARVRPIRMHATSPSATRTGSQTEPPQSRKNATKG